MDIFYGKGGDLLWLVFICIFRYEFFFLFEVFEFFYNLRVYRVFYLLIWVLVKYFFELRDLFYSKGGVVMDKWLWDFILLYVILFII